MHAVPGRVSARPAHPLGPVQRGEALRELPSRLSAGQSGKQRVERKYKTTFNVFFGLMLLIYEPVIQIRVPI